jgi:hypothetical protein
VLQGEEVMSIKNTLIFIDYSTNFGGGGVELMLTASTNGLALDDGLDGPETVGILLGNIHSCPYSFYLGFYL